MGVASQFTPGVDIYRGFLESVADDPNIDCLAVHLVGFRGGGSSDFAASFGEAINKGKPVVTWISDPRMGELVEQLELKRVPVYTSAGRAINALGALYRYYVQRQE
jgi:acyl-CoA synthetase (NDP forming)